MQSNDLRFGCDLKNPDHGKELKRDLEIWKPRLAIIEFPCTVWSQLQHINCGSGARRKRLWKQLREEERPLLELTEQIFDIQVRHGGDALAENPMSSLARKEAPIQRLEARCDNFVLVSRMCMFNKRLLFNNQLLEKPTWWCTNSPEIAKQLERTCRGYHEHAVVMTTKVTEHAGKCSRARIPLDWKR